MPVPRGAAVTDAVLWMNDRPMRGAFVERQRARNIYTSIVTRRRDPALVTWDGPGWIAVSIYPLEKNRPRRFELEWVEPAADRRRAASTTASPVVAEGERVVGRAAVTVDGRKVASRRARSGRHRPRRSAQGVHAAGAGRSVPAGDGARGGPDRRAALRAGRRDVGGDDDRRPPAPARALDALVAELPADAKLTLLAADWDVSPIVEEAGRRRLARRAREAGRVPSAGALHLERALREAAARARKTGAAAVLFVGRGEDGFARRRRVGTAGGDAGRAHAAVGDRRPAPASCRPRSSGRRSRPAARRSRSWSTVRRFARAARRCAAAAPGPAGPRRARRRRVAPAPHDHGRRRLDGTRAGNGDHGGRRDGAAPTPARRWPSISARCGIARASNGTIAMSREEVAKVLTPVDVTAGARDRAGLPALRPRGPRRPVADSRPLRATAPGRTWQRSRRATPASSAC